MSDLTKLFPLIKDQLMEISVGDEYEKILLSDHERNVNGIIYGIMRDLVGDFVILDCYFFNKAGDLTLGNEVYLNTWHIKMFSKVNDNGSLNDITLGVEHIRKMKKLLGLSPLNE